MIENLLDQYLREFQLECDYSLEIYYSSESLYNQPDNNGFSNDMRDMLVEFSFLKLFGKWERFLEEVFIEHMLGGHSENGISVTKYVMPNDAEHAYNLIKSINIYPDWSDIDKILINANNFFEGGGAFHILKTMKSELTSLKKIRNCIAHTSKKARQDFQNLVQGKVGYLPDDITPARFLIEYKQSRGRQSPVYCEYYIQYLKDTAKLIAEFNGFVE